MFCFASAGSGGAAGIFLFFIFFFGKTGVKGPDEVLRDVHTKELLTVSTVASSVCN